MAKQISSGARPAVLRRAPVSRSRRLEHVLGRDWKVALPFVLPMVIIMVGLIFWPFINAILLSFTTRSIVTRTEQFVGMRNYVRLWTDSSYWQAVNNTIVFTVASVVSKLIIGTTIALLLNSRIPFRNVLTGIMLLPWIVPEVVTAMAWRSIYDPLFGGLNPILRMLGILGEKETIAFLANPKLALPSVIAVNIWKGIPFFTMLLLAGLKAIDREQYEAAQVDGADVVQQFRHITLPSLKYTIAVTVLLSTISTFNTFGLVYLMTGGGPGGITRLYSILAYEKAIVGLNVGPGSAVAFSLAPVLGIFILLLARFMRQGVERVENDTPVDRALGAVGKGLGWLFDIVLWPFMALASGVVALWNGAIMAVRGSKPLSLTGRERIGTVIHSLLMLPLLLFVLFPFYWIVITAFKTDLQIQRFESIFWPKPWTIGQFQSLISGTDYLVWFRNTVLVAIVTTLISVTLAALAGYALARLKFVGAGVLTTVLLITYLLPSSLMFIPLYRILTNLGLINSLASLIVTYPTFLMPFSTWVLLGYYRSIPEDLEEAAMIDGANRLVSFLRITLPLAAPALLAVMLFAFTNAWNEFLFAFVFITKDTLKTLPVGLQTLVFGDLYPWGQLMSASLLMAIPVVIVYIYAQKYMVEGLTAGSVKG